MRCPYCGKKVGLRLVGTELLNELEGLDPESLKARGKVIEGLNARAKNALRQAKWRAKKKLEAGK